MDRYFYLTLSLIYLLLAVILIVRVPRLRFAAIAIGIGSAVVGPVSELLFYYKDYWHPVTLSGGRSVSIEHCIFGFSVMVVAMLLYPTLRNITLHSITEIRRS